MNQKLTKIRKLTGGSIHEAWEVMLGEKVCVLKLLHPTMQKNIVEGEAFAQYCLSQGIPAVCALEIEGEILHALDDRMGLFYPLIRGQQKYYPDFGLAEVNKIATILAKIHSLGAISHRDFDPKNVLWVDDQPHIIDWEAAGPIDPMIELVALAFEWSGFERGEIDPILFDGFFKAYAQAGGKVIWGNLNAGLQGFIHNYEEWLEFNKIRQDQRSIALREIDKTNRKLDLLRIVQLRKDEGWPIVLKTS